MSSIFKIISFTKHLKKWYIVISFFVIALSLLSLVGPFLSKRIVDLIVESLKGGRVPFAEVFYLLLGIILTDLAITVLTALSQWLGDRLTVKLQTFLSQKFYHHLLDLHIGYYDNEITGNLINKMYRGIGSITQFLQSMLNNFLPFFLTALVTIFLLAFYSPLIALLLVILFPVYILISHGSTVAWEKFENKKNTLNDLSQGRVFESLTGIRIVKSFSTQALELASFLTKRGNIEGLTIKQTKEWHLYDFFRRFCLNIILFTIYAYIIYWTFHTRYTIGEMTLLLQLVNQARFPLFAMSFILGQIQMASAGSSDFFKVMETKSEIKDKIDAHVLEITPNLPPKKPLVEFNNICFTYDRGKDVLKNISFKIFPGQKVALVGESGEGKSTIVNLLLRYYQSQSGKISVKNENIDNLSQKSLHDNIAVVFQESLLFSGTVEENIKYGNPHASNSDIVKAATAANAHHFIEQLPDKYQSLVGERGVKLSGGQKQRIAIARAILKNAPIIILDEATSSLDSRSELEVQKGLNRLLFERTSIIIAHRLSTIAHADQIIVISRGVVAESGTPRELLNNIKGHYYKLVKLQEELLKAPFEDRVQKLQKFDLVA